MAAENIKHWKIGDVEVARIVEVNACEDDIVHAAAGRDRRVRAAVPVAACRTSRRREGKMIISFQCFVLRSRGKTVMIDTCIGADRKREYDVFCNLQTTFLEDLARGGLPGRSRSHDVLCTHLHFDHVGWNTQLVNGKWVPTFPQARYLFGKKEFDHWEHLRDTGGYHDFDHLHDAIDPVIEAGLVDFIGPDFRITDEVSLFPTPGHTPGHVSVLIRVARQEGRDHRRHDASPDPARRPGRATATSTWTRSTGARTRLDFVRALRETRTC